MSRASPLVKRRPAISRRRRHPDYVLQSGLPAVDAREFSERSAWLQTRRFPNIARVRRFVCSACGSRRFEVSPDWRGHREAGRRQ